MDIKLVNRGEQGEVIISGKLDSKTAPEAELILDDIAKRFNTVILNLSQLDYTSSAGLRIILKLQIKMDKKGGELYVKGANKVVMEVLELTGSAAFLNFID